MVSLLRGREGEFLSSWPSRNFSSFDFCFPWSGLPEHLVPTSVLQIDSIWLKARLTPLLSKPELLGIWAPYGTQLPAWDMKYLGKRRSGPLPSSWNWRFWFFSTIDLAHIETKWAWKQSNLGFQWGPLAPFSNLRRRWEFLIADKASKSPENC